MNPMVVIREAERRILMYNLSYFHDIDLRDFF